MLASVNKEDQLLTMASLFSLSRLMVNKEDQHPIMLL